MFPDDSQEDLGSVLCYAAGRKITREKSGGRWSSPRSAFCEQIAKGNANNSRNLRRVATNLGMNRVSDLPAIGLIEPEEVNSVAEELGSVWADA